MHLTSFIKMHFDFDKVYICRFIQQMQLSLTSVPIIFNQDTGKLPNGRNSYDGPPIHTVTVFANPIINKPSLDDPGVYQVQPGENPPSEGSWDTLYFLPGIHDIGIEFIVKANKSYYIPGDAIVYGTFSSHDEWDNGKNIHIYGHGTISGDRIPHPKSTNFPENEYWKFRPIGIEGRNHQIFSILLIII